MMMIRTPMIASTSMWMRVALELLAEISLSSIGGRAKIQGGLGSGQAGKATDFGSVYRGFESLLPSLIRPPRSHRPRRSFFFAPGAGARSESYWDRDIPNLKPCQAIPNRCGDSHLA